VTANHIKPEDLEWKCVACNRKLVIGPVLVDYLGNQLSTELPQCPSCKMVLISEELALGKVAEVEKLLEDK
jgi:hypothetical protein